MGEATQMRVASPADLDTPGMGVLWPPTSHGMFGEQVLGSIKG
jgi:hypothetical protein